MAILTPTKLAIQNGVIITAMIFIFGIVAASFVMPSTFYVTDFQKNVSDNALILLVVIVSGSITAIALNRRDSRTDELLKAMIEKQLDIKVKDIPED